MAKQTEEEIKRALCLVKFDVSPKVRASFVRMEIQTLGQLSDMQRSRVFKYRNVGEKAVEEMDRLLSKNGLSWKDEDPKPPKIVKPKVVEDDAMKERRDVQSHNRKLIAEVARLTDEVLKSNLEKVRMEGRIKELEAQTQRLTNILAMK